MRQSNIELCRIITMLMILAVHSTYQTFGLPSGWERPNFGLILLHYSTIIGVNVFALMTGFFSLSIKKRSLFRYLFTCLFYGVLLLICSICFLDFNIRQLFFISQGNWYVSAYLGLIFFSPVLNAFVEKIDKAGFRKILVCLIGFQIWYEFIPKEVSNFHSGYSILSLIIIYLLGRYFRLYGIPRLIIRYRYAIYIFISVISAIISWECYTHGFHGDYIDLSLRRYNNPMVLLSATAFFSIFLSLRIKQSRAINHIARSSFPVLIVHTSDQFLPYYSAFFRRIFVQNQGFTLILAWGGEFS